MDGFAVQPGELTEAAALIRDLGEHLATDTAADDESDPADFGNDILASALQDLQDGSWRSVTTVSAGAAAVADRLNTTAATYEDIDYDHARIITQLDQPRNG